jgi:predicted nucleic acid-binding protein
LREVVLDASVAVRVLAPNDEDGFALQARLRAPLLTTDKRLANAPGLPCVVEVIS